ncbi:MAG: deoxyguanosinetriphosphate triphosphohydrolase family protein, partial [Fibrobacterota bacterium]
MGTNFLNEIVENHNRYEDMRLSEYASRSSRAVCKGVLKKNEIRPRYAVDSDRILHSRSFTRYIDKTQVFYAFENDHLTHRVLHVQLVSKIARTIGRILRLNEDLIEAVALGHDIGHTPFGHEGEKYLSDICEKKGIGNFRHNIHSVRMLSGVENRGLGLDLSLQVFDGILCHDGESTDDVLVPKSGKTWASHESDIEKMTLDRSVSTPMPMTTEGCVVRFADTIAYIGRDVEDAIALNIIKRSDLPKEVSEVLG